MRRIISAIVCLACLCMLLALPVAAAPTDPLAVQFQTFINDCDSLYAGDVMECVLSRARAAYVSEENPGPVEVPAEEFETELEKYIVLNEAFKNSLRSLERGLYDSATGKYEVQYSVADTDTSGERRQYKGYVKTAENTYAVYYQIFEPETLNVSTEIISQHKNPITGNVEYNGKVYVQDSDGKYYCVKSWGNGGVKYSIEMIDGRMRLVSGEAYGADMQPETFDDAVVTYDLPKDNTVYLSDIACFPNNTTLKVEKITQADSLEKIAQTMANVSVQYVPYEFTATQNDVSVQPTGKLKVYFAIPEDFGANTVVMYMAPDGVLSELLSMVKNIEGTSYLVADLEHFSTYILVDKDAKPAEQTTPTVAPTAEPTTEPTTAATQVTTAPTKATAAATNATTAATQATNGATKATVAATKPISSTPTVKPTVPATGEMVADPTEETIIDPTGEPTVAPTDAVSAPTDETAAAPTEAPKPAKSNKTGGIVAAVIIVVLAAGGAAAWWFYFRKKKA